jgi:hypothetical protein
MIYSYNPPNNIPGIYYLVKGDEIVYVGISLSCCKRGIEHRINKDFDYQIIDQRDLSYRDLLDEEHRLIQVLLPRLNIVGMPSVLKEESLTAARAMQRLILKVLNKRENNITDDQAWKEFDEIFKQFKDSVTEGINEVNDRLSVMGITSCACGCGNKRH